jgi:hypothetical protein
VQCADCSVLFLNTASVHGFPFFFSFFFFELFFLCLIDETVFCFYTLYFTFGEVVGQCTCTDLFFFLFFNELFFTF